MLVDVGQVVPSQSGKVLSRLVHHKVAGDEVKAPAAQLPGVVQLGEEEEGWGGGGGEFQCNHALERASQEEQNRSNFGFVAPSSEELWVRQDNNHGL